jgi:hypothetical protein
MVWVLACLLACPIVLSIQESIVEEEAGKGNYLGYKAMAHDTVEIFGTYRGAAMRSVSAPPSWLLPDWPVLSSFLRDHQNAYLFSYPRVVLV